MSADDSLRQQVREQFATGCRLSGELTLMSERMVRANVKLPRLEVAIGTGNADNPLASEYQEMTSGEFSIEISWCNQEFRRHDAKFPDVEHEL